MGLSLVRVLESGGLQKGMHGTEAPAGAHILAVDKSAVIVTSGDT